MTAGREMLAASISVTTIALHPGYLNVSALITGLCP
jgi:hypothetical protein